jgi:DNA-binding GntR family transcriptional regulator
MPPDDETLHRVLSDALLSARIAPGAALREVALSEVFGVSRERVRKVLQRLGAERLLELIPNRGAFAAAPTLDQAREVYEARRILEGGIAGYLAQTLDEPTTRALAAHIGAEQRAVEQGDRAASIRLSGEFHLMLARATRNALVLGELQHLVSRTSMLVALFEPARAMRCACEEHGDILSALSAGDSSRAMKAMQQHLALIETRLRPNAEQPSGDAVEVIRADWAALQAAPQPASGLAPKVRR